MNKQDILRHYRNDKLILSKTLDKYQLCERNYEVCFTSFIDPGNVTAIVDILSKEKDRSVHMLVYGGAEDCERRMIGFFPDFLEPSPELAYKDFPIDCLKISFTNKFRALSHRDFLGSLISLGIDRSKLGDIFVLERYAIIFVSNDVSGFICTSLKKAGNVGVVAELVNASDILVYQKTGNFKTVHVASLRLDIVISAAFNVSRGLAAEYIGKDKCFVNWASITKPSHLVNGGDVISLRGYGRAVIQDITENKDRFVLMLMINQ